MFSNDGQNIIGSFSDEDIYSFKTRDSAEKPEYDKRYQGHCNSQTGKLKAKQFQLRVHKTIEKKASFHITKVDKFRIRLQIFLPLCWLKQIHI